MLRNVLRKIEHVIVLMHNLYTGLEGIVQMEHGNTHWLQIGKGVRDYLFNLHEEYILR